MKFLFLDIDGVLNDHSKLENGYCGTDREMVSKLNRILDCVPDLHIVVSSAWRYVVHNGESTVKGLEHLLLTHGLKCHGRLHGVTDPDPETFDHAHHTAPFDVEYWKERGLKWRGDQIRKYCEEHTPSAFIVIDDIDLPIEPDYFVKIDGSVGLTAADVVDAIALLPEGEA